MASIDQIQVAIIVETNHSEQLKNLTTIINDASTPNDLKIHCLQSRVIINIELKRWNEVIQDVNALEALSIDSPSLSMVKIKAQIQDCCRQGRTAIMEIINNGYHSNEIEQFFLNISQKNVDQFLDGPMVSTKSRTTAKAMRQLQNKPPSK